MMAHHHDIEEKDIIYDLEILKHHRYARGV